MAFETRRAGEHLSRLSLLALVVTLVVAGIGGLDSVAARMIAAGAAEILTDAEPAAQTSRVVALKTDSADDQDAEMRDAITTAFAGIDHTVSRQAALETDAETAMGETFTLGLLDDERTADLADLTGGEWPRSPEQIALPDAAAQRLQLDIGDTVTIAGNDEDNTDLTLVGIWSATDPTDPAWHGDPAVVSGASDGVIGPAIVAAGALTHLTRTPTVTWEIAPVDLEPAGIPQVQRALATLHTLPDDIDPQRQQSTRVIGGLDATLERQASAVAATRGLLVAPLLIIALLGVLVLGIVLTTLSIARREEIVLLRARGSSARRLAVDAGAEAALVAAAGAALAIAVLAASTGASTSALLTAAGAILFAGVAAGVLTVRAARRGMSPDLRSDAGVRTLPMLLLPAGIAVGVAALSAWQLFGTGGLVGPDGAPDPLATAAPALLLIAACTLAPLAAAPIAALAERMLRRTRGTAPILPLRQIARRMGTVAVAILCLALAAASATLAVTAPASAAAAEQRTRTALLGWDVRVVTDDELDLTADLVGSWSDVAGAAEVLRTPLTIGSDTAALVAGTPEVLGATIPAGTGDSIAVGITRSLSNRLGAGEGTVFTARIQSVVRPVAFEVTEVLDDLPGVGDGWGVAVSPDELSAAGVDLPPDELWLRSETPEQLAGQLRAHTTHPVRILTAAQVSAAPVTSVTPALLAAGSLVAAVLGVIGFLAASSAAARARRDESFVLRALGLRPSHQRVLRLGETSGVAVYAVLTGAALGAIVAAAVLPIILRVDI
ncbi:MAG: FtsX-like permease family protein [Microbacteriaceae bacterium]